MKYYTTEEINDIKEEKITKKIQASIVYNFINNKDGICHCIGTYCHENRCPLDIKGHIVCILDNIEERHKQANLILKSLSVGEQIEFEF